MTGPQVTNAVTLLAQALRQRHCDSTKGLMAQLRVANGSALLARLGCAGNTVALWEQLTEEVAQRLLPQDEIAVLVAEWFPFPEALREFGARALDAGADPRAPCPSPEMKLHVLARLSRPAQVAFETYALAREVAIRVVSQLR
jgi:hypothetical protein